MFDRINLGPKIQIKYIDIQNKLADILTKLNVTRVMKTNMLLTDDHAQEEDPYFMTKHTEEFSQFIDAVTCREYPLSRDASLFETKGWIRGNTKIGSVLKLKFVAYKINMEWKSDLNL